METIRRSFEPVLAEWETEEADQVLLALLECEAIVVEHSDPSLGDGCIRIQAKREPNKLQFRISEFCKEGDIPTIHHRNLDEIRPGGLGTYFVEEIMTRVFFEPEEGCPNSMTLVLELTRDV